MVGAGPGGRGAFAPPKTRAKDLAVLMYTSGSEGQPKGAMLSHGAMRANIDALAKIRRPAAMEPDDRLLLVLPMFHIYGLNAGLGLVAKVGATCVLLDRFEPRSSLAAVRELGVTNIAGAPPMYVVVERGGVPARVDGRRAPADQRSLGAAPGCLRPVPHDHRQAHLGGLRPHRVLPGGHLDARGPARRSPARSAGRCPGSRSRCATPRARRSTRAIRARCG